MIYIFYTHIHQGITNVVRIFLVFSQGIFHFQRFLKEGGILEELEKARHEAMVPLQGRLAEVIAAVARRHKLALVVNTDSNAYPFIDPEMGMDIYPLVTSLLQK